MNNYPDNWKEIKDGTGMHKDDLWCGYCGTQDFIELPRCDHPDDSRYSQWACLHCHAIYEDNPGYGYFTVSWGDNAMDAEEPYSLNTGELIDDSKPPRTPEGIVRHSGSREESEAYLKRTQVK